MIRPGEGRGLFGGDPAAYDRGRPAYPARVFDVLEEEAGLGPGAHILDVGAGTGLATLELARRGAASIVAVEPNARMAQQLRKNAAASSAGATSDAIEVIEAAFEDYDPPAGSFDLVTAATSFHWIDEATGLAKARVGLRAGGTIALWWHVFGDPEQDDPFHEATRARLAVGRHSPSGGEPGGPRHALDVDARTGALRAAGFVDVRHERMHETTRFTPAQLRDLYSTFSNTAHLSPDERDELLDYIEETAANDFGGEVERPLVLSLYVAGSSATARGSR